MQNTQSSIITKTSRWLIIGFISICCILVISSFLAIRSENRHREAASLYADAFMLYSKINQQKPYVSQQEEQVNQAIASLKQLTQRYTSFTEVYLSWLQMGLLYIYKKDPKSAISVLENIQNAPNAFISKPQAMTLLARLYEQENLIDKALGIYSNMVHWARGESRNFAYYQLGILYSTNKKTLNQAIESYMNISAPSPLRSLADRNLFIIKAVAHMNLGKTT